MSVKAFAVIAGVGSGTGASVARIFAKKYPVALLARKPQSYESLVKEINDGGGSAIGISADVSNEENVKAAFQKIKEEYKDAPCAAAIYQASGGFVKKPFLDMKLEELDQSWVVTVYACRPEKRQPWDIHEADKINSKGAVIFSQAALPLLVKHGEDSSAYPPTLIFTGATASLKANAQMASFAAPKWALRALSASLAREFAPQGVHVAHAIIDGIIDIPKSQEMLKDTDQNARLGPDDIAEAYWNLHTQSRRGFTNELDIRPMLEKW